MNNKRNIIAAIAVLLTVMLAFSAMYVSYRLSTGQPIIPTSTRAAVCEDSCPSSRDATILNNCTPPEPDGSPQTSVCNEAGRIEPCGGQNFCCPSPGSPWTTNMTACPTAAPTIAPTVAPTETPSATVNECGTCGGTSNAGCVAGLTCDLTDGKCKKTDGTSVCFETSAACAVSATSVCVPTDVVTCAPDCSTACGQTAKIITTCTNSCGIATTKQCSATNACSNALTLTNRAYRNEASNTPGSYAYQNEIAKVARNQTYVYDITIQNKGEVDANDITITNVLNGENQGLLTFIDAHDDCTYNSNNRTVTCSGIDVKAGQTGFVAFRVRVGNNAVNGEEIQNTATGRISDGSVTATNSLTISTVVGCNQTCTQNSECSIGLICDTGADRCRRAACLAETDCTCPVVVTTTPTATVTAAPTTTLALTGTPTATATAVATTGTPTISLPAVEEEPEVLPETGILDFPGIAAFGGGLLLAVLGILLAL